MTETPKFNTDPKESTTPDQAIMRAHLTGLLGNLQTLKRWGETEENDDRTELEKQSDLQNYGSYYKKTFGDEAIGPKCEELLSKVKLILANPESAVDKNVYDEIFSEWNSIKK